MSYWGNLITMGSLELLMSGFLTTKNRTQYTMVNGVHSDLRSVSIGVPQGSVAGPLLFLILINDLANVTDFDTILFADDTTFQQTGPIQTDLFAQVNQNLAKAEQLFSVNYLTLNSMKTKYILFSP